MQYCLPITGKLHFIVKNADPLAKTLANEIGKNGFSSDLVNGEGLIQNQSKISYTFEVAKVYLLLQFISKRITNSACLKVCMCMYTYMHTHISPSIPFSFSFVYMYECVTPYDQTGFRL